MHTYAKWINILKAYGYNYIGFLLKREKLTTMKYKKILTRN